MTRRIKAGLSRLGAKGSDMVKITLSLTANLTTALGGLLNKLQLLQGLDDLAGNRSRGIGVVARAGSAVLAATVGALKGSNTGTRADVQRTGNRS